MWQCSYAKEPFDLRLFVLQSIRRWKWLLLGTIIGTLLIGGGYYLCKVTLGGKVPYQVVNKFYIEYDYTFVTLSKILDYTKSSFVSFPNAIQSNIQFSSVEFSRSVVSDSLRPHE